VTVTVEDASRVPPCPRTTDAAKPGGFGWFSVQNLAMDVQVSVRPSGKTVSAVLPLPHRVASRCVNPLGCGTPSA
jgi:hypothetical protein